MAVTHLACEAICCDVTNIAPSMRGRAFSGKHRTRWTPTVPALCSIYFFFELRCLFGSVFPVDVAVIVEVLDAVCLEDPAVLQIVPITACRPQLVVLYLACQSLRRHAYKYVVHMCHESWESSSRDDSFELTPMRVLRVIPMPTSGAKGWVQHHPGSH